MRDGRQGVRVDPAVLAALGDGERRQRLRVMSPGQRRKLARDEERTTATFDLPPALLGELRALAGKEDCSLSSLVAFLLRMALDRQAAGEFDMLLMALMRESRSPRFRYVVEYPTRG